MLALLCKLELLEFHLCYKDLDIKTDDFLLEPEQCQLVVRAPELFARNHGLNLVSEGAH